MAVKGYSSFFKALGIEPHHQMQFSVIPRTLVGGRIRQPQLTGQCCICARTAFCMNAIFDNVSKSLSNKFSTLYDFFLFC